MAGGFHDVVFPDNIKRGLRGGPRFNTTIVTSNSGVEQRNQNYSQRRRSWVVSLESWDEQRLEEILTFFEAREGKTFSFRFRDWSNYYAGMYQQPGVGLAYKSGLAAEPLGVGNGSLSTFQLAKRRVSGPITVTWTATMPRQGTIRVYVDGTQKTEVAHYNVDYLTGAVTFTAGNIPTAGQIITWGGMFDALVRFDTDELDFDLNGIVSGIWASIPIIELRE